MKKQNDYKSVAEAFITVPEEQQIGIEDTENVPMKLNPIYIEKKSRHVQLLMQPSVHKKIAKIAKKNKVSFNEMIHIIANEYNEK